jgi:predicted metalloprotease
MRMDDLEPTENVDDRRGQGGGGFGGFSGRGLAIGGGGIGTVVIVIILALLGVDPSQLLSGSDPSAPTSPEATQPGAPPGPRADDAQVYFSRQIIGSADEEWRAIFRQYGREYRPVTFTPYDGATQTAGCGSGEAAMGPFYCPADTRVYIDMSFFRELASRFGAPGQFAQAYVIAHEVGHHVQNQLGISEQADRSGDRRGANSASVALELQADCFAGVWANHANARHHILENGDVESGLAAANAVGDDTLQRATRGTIEPDSFTHGTSAQRVQWFRTGLQSGDPNSCDTFGQGRVF